MTDFHFLQVGAGPLPSTESGIRPGQAMGGTSFDALLTTKLTIGSP